MVKMLERLMTMKGSSDKLDRTALERQTICTHTRTKRNHKGHHTRPRMPECGPLKLEWHVHDTQCGIKSLLEMIRRLPAQSFRCDVDAHAQVTSAVHRLDGDNTGLANCQQTVSPKPTTTGISIHPLPRDSIENASSYIGLAV